MIPINHTHTNHAHTLNSQHQHCWSSSESAASGHEQHQQIRCISASAVSVHQQHHSIISISTSTQNSWDLLKNWGDRGCSLYTLAYQRLNGKKYLLGGKCSLWDTVGPKPLPKVRRGACKGTNWWQEKRTLERCYIYRAFRAAPVCRSDQWAGSSELPAASWNSHLVTAIHTGLHCVGY